MEPTLKIFLYMVPLRKLKVLRAVTMKSIVMYYIVRGKNVYLWKDLTIPIPQN